MLISFSKSPPSVPLIKVDGVPLERVNSCTLLGVELNDKLTWTDHIDKIHKKAAQRLHFLSQLRRTKMTPKDMVNVYTSLIRPIIEYAAQLWHPGLTSAQIDLLESIQQRALSIAYPTASYEEALQASGLDTLSQRRDELCKRLFSSCQDTTHKLHSLLPKERKITHGQRNAYKYHLPLVKTNRCKDSFINYCLFKKW